MNFRLILGVAFFALAAVTPVHPQVPAWSLTHQDPRFPPGIYLLGVGHASGENAAGSARRSAQSDIAVQLRARVQAESKKIQRAYDLARDQNSYADFKIGSTSIVDDNLPDAQIVETAVDSSAHTTYVLAALNMQELSRTIAAQLAAGWDRSMNLRQTAEDCVRKGKLTEGIQDLFDARSAVLELLPKEAMHDALAAVPFAGIPALSPSALTAVLHETLSAVHIEKIGGERQRAKTGVNFPQPFVVRVTGIVDGKPVPVTGAEIAFTNSSGEKFGTAITDPEGTASCSIKARGNIGQTLRAGLSLPSTGREFASAIDASSVEFACSLLQADVAFGIKIDVRSPSVNDVLRSCVTNAVTRAGYQIVDMSRFLLRVEFQSAPPAGADSLGGALYSTASEFSLILIDKSSNSTLGSIGGKSMGSAKTLDEAVLQSARGMKLDPDALASLLEKAKD